MRKTLDFKVFPLLAALLAGLAFSCRDEVLTEETEALDTGRAVAEAMDFYNSLVESDITLRAGKKDVRTMQVKPAWEYVTVSRNRQYTAVEVALRSEYGFVYTLPENGAKSETTGDFRYNSSKTNFVILTDNHTRKRQMFMMTVVPTVQYIERTDFQPFRKISYLERGKDFSGLVFYHHADGTMANGWRYGDGKILSRLHFDNSPRNFVNTRSRAWVDYWEYECIEWEISVGGYTKPGRTCKYVRHTIYVDEEEDGSSGGGGYDASDNGGNGGGGSSGGGGGTAIQGVAEKVSLDNSAQSELKRALENILLKCGFSNIKQHLSNSNAFTFSNISIDPSMTNGNAYYNPTDRTLTFKDKSYIYGSFLEEYMHLYQDNIYIRGIAPYLNTKSTNIEFEAKFLMDLVCRVTAYACPPQGSGINDNDYIRWMNDLAEKYEYGQLTYNYIMKEYWTFAEDFRQYWIDFNKKNPTKKVPQYTKPLDKNMDATAIRNIIHQLSCN